MIKLEDIKINLSKVQGRETFLGKVSQFGTMKKGKIKTICVENIRLKKTGKQVTSHVWFVYGNAFNKQNIVKGTDIVFRAKVVTYVKGKYQEKIDYSLNFPSHVRVLD
jgi:chemotaxis methyl-accepting protein methylase